MKGEKRAVKRKLRMYKEPSALFLYRREILWTALTLAWLFFIYSNSMKTASQSSDQSQLVLRVVEQISETIGIGTGITEHLIRKTAHFVEYMVLGLLLSQTVRAWGFFASSQLWIVPLAGFFMAAADETIQLFREGRSGQFTDVLLDLAGVIAGLALIRLIGRLRGER